MSFSLMAIVIFLSAVLFVQTVAAFQPAVDLNRKLSQPQDRSCGDIVQQNLYDDELLFKATDVIECLTSVPFDPAVGLRFLDYLNATYQFHATTAYQKRPPQEYQQTPLDLFGELNRVRKNVIEGHYHNQYAFETAIQRILQRTHDQHLRLHGGISSRFSFLSSTKFISVSEDGKKLPEIYVYDDLNKSVSYKGYSASPVDTINGVEAVAFLTEFANNQSFGMLEPHADWNTLMGSPAQDLFGVNSLSDSAFFYPGDQLVLNFKNGSSPVNSPWWALYNSVGFTGPLETGGDFYNFYVLGIPPANFVDQFRIYLQNSSTRNSDEDNSFAESYTLFGDDALGLNKSSWHEEVSAYPAITMSHQAKLGMFTSGSVTGYFLPEISTAVLSLPSFEMYGKSTKTFEAAIKDFIRNATTADRNASRVIIDLQQNDGGLVGLAYYVMEQFFPNFRPSSGSRTRSQPFADALGRATTNRFDSLTSNFNDIDYLLYMTSPWTATNRINTATGRNFTSWGHFYGPKPLNGDQFSLVEQADLSNPVFVQSILGVDMDPCYYTRSCDAMVHWNAEDMVILTDGVCGSTCALFVEMMQEAGVHTVVVGGRPQVGPMQAASGSRAAVAYSADQISDDYEFLQDEADITTTSPSPLPSNTDMWTTFIGFTLRDQIKKDQAAPNQVLYMPADCRLYWTMANFYNYTRLWMDVHGANFVDSSVCVSGSTNVISAPSLPQLEKRSPEPAGETVIERFKLAVEDPTADVEDFPVPLIDGDPLPLEKLTICKSDEDCYVNRCLKFNFDCGCNDESCTEKLPFGVCVQTCPNGDNSQCPGSSRCLERRRLISRANSVIFDSKILTIGVCIPSWVEEDKERPCDSWTTTTDLQRYLNNRWLY